MRRPRPARAEDGVILLTVMLIVAVMSALAVAIVDDIRYGVKRTVNAALRDQAYWYALGLEHFATLIVERSWEAAPGKSTLNDPWAQEGARFPIEGGFIDGVIADGSNCFNVNSLVGVEEGSRDPINREAAAQFQALLTALDVGPGAELAIVNGVADWIDADNAPLARGAEDYLYTNLTPPYRTGDTLMADVTELRAVQTVTERAYRAMRPYVCALPTTGMSPVNINTLREEDAPLLAMLFPGRLDVEAARRVIADRPAGGYDAIEEFWGLPSIQQVRPPEGRRPNLQVWTEFYDLSARVVYQEAYFQLQATFRLDGQGKLRFVSRRFGAFE
ncbi:MAG: type II secretion system minor pseudopilin GspK [Pseudomonadota bacterium]